MLRLVDSSSAHSRREFLQIGTAGIGGLTLANLLRSCAEAGDRATHLRDRSVVLLNLQGGPTQYETFDPKMTAPREIRSITGEIQTALPGVTFGGTLPRLAAMADRMAVVRSYRHGISSHGPAAKHVMAGGNPTGAMMGALYSRVAGLTNRQTGMPQNALITARAFGDEYKHLYESIDRVSENGTLPRAYRPFNPNAGGDIIDNMRLNVADGRLQDRRGLLTSLDQLRREADSSGLLESADRFQQQAFDVLTRGVADAFDLSKEDAALLGRYDTGAMEPTAAVKGRNSYATQFSPIALGRQMVLARRLVEAGCGFVTVTQGGWDMHGGGKEFTMKDGLDSLLPAVDKAVSAFVEDLEQRGLSERVLLVITGEFGRTPRINKNGGRDHWGNLCTLAFVGGGLKMGRVIGRSDRIGGEPASTPISSSNVLATVMHSLFNIGELRLQTGVAKDVERIITAGEPIRELI
ncbi:MAG: DUF1501 domain-containing protein [Planctomycetota bacterium]|nr:DUF1501 domain-containing protein [Planctomycetota bacterium]